MKRLTNINWRSPYAWAWLVWGLAFGVIEGAALIDDGAGDTLSEHIWELGGISSVALAGLGIFMLWLGHHMVKGARRVLRRRKPEPKAALSDGSDWDNEIFYTEIPAAGTLGPAERTARARKADRDA